MAISINASNLNDQLENNSIGIMKIENSDNVYMYVILHFDPSSSINWCLLS